jgi:hypothetical protein
MSSTEIRRRRAQAIAIKAYQASTAKQTRSIFD